MVLRNFIASFFFIFFFTIFSNYSFGQQIFLKLAADNENEKEKIILENIKLKKIHLNETTLYNEVEKISNYLKQIGFFENNEETIKKNDSLYIATFSLGKKTEYALIAIPKNFQLKSNQFPIKNDSLYIGVEYISDFLTIVSKDLDERGRLFSEVQLKNIRIKDNFLIADLSIKESEERKINQIIVKPYSKFPKSFLKHYLNIKKTKILNQQKLTKISEDTKSLKFVSEVKVPEVLFTKDSTLLYLYLKKEQNNSFDGLINFATKENGGILFNGHVDLKLNNILNTGESFELFWNSIAEEVQDFKLATTIPYVFSSPLTTSLAFNIYKQDSTFLNTNFQSSISYAITPKTNLFLSYNSESSNNLETNFSNEILSFDTKFIGAGFNYQIRNQNKLEDLFYIKLSAEIGSRKTDAKKTSQIKLLFNASYIWQLNYRNSIFIKNEASLLNSDSFLTNELFRIGGANSIRGFNEQSIFTSKYTYFNTEYRYLTSETSYLFSITDFGTYTTSSEKSNFLIGIGLGYTFKSNNNIFKLSYAVGKNQDDNFYVNKSKIIINWIINF